MGQKIGGEERRQFMSFVRAPNMMCFVAFYAMRSKFVNVLNGRVSAL